MHQPRRHRGTEKTPKRQERKGEEVVLLVFSLSSPSCLLRASVSPWLVFFLHSQPKNARTPSSTITAIDRTASRVLTLDRPARRFSKMIGVSPILQPASRQRNSTSCWNE